MENKNNTEISTKDGKWSQWWRIPRFIVYIFGIITIYWYFWCIIGLVIGIIYFIFLNDPAWKRNGIVLSLYIGFITTLIYLNLHGIGIWFPPLNLVLWYGTGFIITYLIIIIAWISRKKRFLSIRVTQWISHKSEKISNKMKILIDFFLILIPITSWILISIDFEVMLDNNPHILWIHAPSKVKVGENFNITIEAWDQFERLSAVYNGEVKFSIESYDLSNYNSINSVDALLPNEYIFTGQLLGSDIAYEILDGKDNGRHVFEISINTLGIHYIRVEDSITQNTFYSNPIIVDNFPDSERMLYWGDLHTHSQLSDGSGTPEHNFYYARYIACIDYMALTDHGEILLFSPGSLDIIEFATNNANEPNIFVTFQGIEWTNTRTGHYTCIFSGDQLLKNPILSYLTVPSTNGLWDALDNFTSSTGSNALALPHHTTKRSYPQDWTYINPKYVKIAEVCSVHGDFLYEQRDELNYRGAIDPPPIYTPGSSIIDALKMGKKLTLYAASDVHDGHPGHSLSHTRAFIGHQRPFSTWHTRNEHPYPGGLTAVYADNLTREGIFDGLENQRIFANSDHGRPILHFTINGIDVGDNSTVFVANKNSSREINLFLAQDGAPVALKSQAAQTTSNWLPNWNATIEIIKNGELWYKEKVNSPIQKISKNDDEPIVGANYEDNCLKIGDNYYINTYSDNPINPTTLNTGGCDFYLIRVVGENGRTSYVGPIWVESVN